MTMPFAGDGNAANPSPKLGTFPVPYVPTASALTDAATIAVNAALGNDFTVTVGASRTMGNPSNPASWQIIRFHITQGGAGSFTITWSSAYDFGAAGAPTLSTAAGKVDVVGFQYDPNLAKWCCLGSALGF